MKHRLLLTRAIEGWIHEAEKLDSEEAAEQYLLNEIQGVFKKITPALETVVKTECGNAQTMSKLDEIIKYSDKRDIKDPIVYWVCKHDKFLCQDCKNLHILEDGVTPRLWKLSSVSSSYHKRGQSSPSLLGLHPNCRCSLVQYLPDYGFNEKGKIKYVGIGYDEFSKQNEKIND